MIVKNPAQKIKKVDEFLNLVSQNLSPENLSAEILAEISAEFSAETLAEISAEISAETLAETSAEISAERTPGTINSEGLSITKSR